MRLSKIVELPCGIGDDKEVIGNIHDNLELLKECESD